MDLEIFKLFEKKNPFMDLENFKFFEKKKIPCMDLEIFKIFEKIYFLSLPYITFG